MTKESALTSYKILIILQAGRHTQSKIKLGIKRVIVRRIQGMDRTSWRQRMSTHSFAQNRSIYQQYHCPVLKTLWSPNSWGHTVVPQICHYIQLLFPESVFSTIYPPAFCLPHFLTLQPFQGKNLHLQYSQNSHDLNGSPLALLKYKQHRFNTDYSMNPSNGLKRQPRENSKS